MPEVISLEQATGEALGAVELTGSQAVSRSIAAAPHEAWEARAGLQGAELP